MPQYPTAADWQKYAPTAAQVAERDQYVKEHAGELITLGAGAAIVWAVAPAVIEAAVVVQEKLDTAGDVADLAVSAAKGDVGGAVAAAAGIILPEVLEAAIDGPRMTRQAARIVESVGDAADARRVWTATDDGVILPPNTDIDAVPRASPDKRNPIWGEVHGSHPHPQGDPRAHAHGPEPDTGKRIDQPLADMMRRLDDGLRSGELRLKTGRSDRGGEIL